MWRQRWHTLTVTAVDEIFHESAPRSAICDPSSDCGGGDGGFGTGGKNSEGIEKVNVTFGGSLAAVN